jgi:hypothetical protein
MKLARPRERSADRRRAFLGEDFETVSRDEQMSRLCNGIAADWATMPGRDPEDKRRASRWFFLALQFKAKAEGRPLEPWPADMFDPDEVAGPFSEAP